MTARGGWVYLVGAGPGDPGLITRRGLELLRTCDVVVHDRLVAPELVAEAASARAVYAGKSPGGEGRDQEDINRVLEHHARRGLAVVRLKGGDPFVLGRGGEEALALKRAGIPFEVVPGVTSAVAVPAYAGIPVTHRGVARSFAVLSAHDLAEPQRVVDLARGADTLVLMMGVATLARAAEVLTGAGRSAAEQAAIVEWGTTQRQRTVVAPLGEIAHRAAELGVASPATVVVGNVVELASELEWFGALGALSAR